MKLNKLLFCVAWASVSPAFAAERFEIGPWKSRAIWTPTSTPAPAIIMLPGSGPNGPQEMIPGAHTTNGKGAPLFNQLRIPFEQAHFNVLSLGKPGVEFADEESDNITIDPATWFYDVDLYKGLKWKDLITNLSAGIEFLRSQPSVDPDRIYILGHSEGTDVAIDYALSDSRIAGLILLGFSGEDIKTVVEWQLIDRLVDFFIKTDVDLDQDAWVTREEAARWPIHFSWDFSVGGDRVSIDEIRSHIAESPAVRQVLRNFESSPLYSDGVFNRGPIYEKAASLPMPLYLFTGDIDLQTPLRESEELMRACDRVEKMNCYLEVIPGVGHGFSPPRAPRSHPYLDMTVGPVVSRVTDLLKEFAMNLVK